MNPVFMALDIDLSERELKALPLVLHGISIAHGIITSENRAAETAAIEALMREITPFLQGKPTRHVVLALWFLLCVGIEDVKRDMEMSSGLGGRETDA